MKFADVRTGDYVMETSYYTSNSSVGDDFDVYFRRAAELQLQQPPQPHRLTTAVDQAHLNQQQHQGPTVRRDSTPNRRSSSSERRRSGGGGGGGGGSVRHKRTSSCRYPQRRPTVTVTRDRSPPLPHPGEHAPLTGTACHRQGSTRPLVPPIKYPYDTTYFTGKNNKTACNMLNAFYVTCFASTKRRTLT